MAHSCLTKTQKFDDPHIQSTAKAANKLPAAVLLRWALALPNTWSVVGTADVSHAQENWDIQCTIQTSGDEPMLIQVNSLIPFATHPQYIESNMSGTN
jgi:diketogulonate reductase-like aldo/keto reductase